VTEFSADAGTLERFFIPGGDYTLDFFINHMEEELGLFLAELAKTRHEQDIVSHGLQTWPEEKSFWRLEIAYDNFILQRFRQMRMQIFSIAPLIYYLLRRSAEIKLIRTIIKCKLIGMARPQVEAHLRYLYV
jgi:vacuolar-type H+-ATPase subunit C/Vma6